MGKEVSFSSADCSAAIDNILMAEERIGLGNVMVYWVFTRSDEANCE